MGGSVSLPLTVEIAFAAGALDTGTLTWTDVTTYVRKDSISFNRGWDTESQEPIAGRASLSFNNESGNFTPGKTGAFGLIRNRLPIRIKQGSTVLWTGLVESWRIGWTNGMRSKVDVTCVDRWAALRRLKIPADRIAAVAKATKADVFFPMTDTAAPFREGGLGTSAWPTLAPVAGSVQPLYAGSAAPTTDSVRVASWDVPATQYGLTYSAQVIDTWSLDTGVSLTATFNYSPRAGGAGATASVQLGRQDWQLNGSYMFVSFGPTAVTAYVTGPSGAGSVTAAYSTTAHIGRWTTATLVAKRTGTTLTVTLYVNGDQVATSSGSVSSDFPSPYFYELEHSVNDGASAASAGVVIHRRALTANEARFVSGQANSAAGDKADTRAATLSNSGPVTLSTTGTFTIPMSKQDLADKSLADALLECAQAEDGALFVDTSGWPKITSRSWRTQATVAFTIPAKALASDIGWTLDDQQLTNSAAVDRMVGDATAGTATGRNDASVALYGEQKVSRQLWLYNTADAVERANAEANMWANPLPRSSELTVDLMTKGATISAATLLAADVGQRIAISGMPAEAPTQTNFYIEAISDTVTETSWLRTFTVSPRLDFLTLDDASSGAIDSTFVLAP